MGKYDFQQVGGAKVFRPWGHWTEGDSIVGKYVSTSEDNFGNTNYEIETLEVEFDDDRVVYLDKKNAEVICLAPKVGELFCLNSAGFLENAMEKVDIGDIVKVIYTGQITLSKGKFAGKPAHTGKVLRSAGEGNKLTSAPVTNAVGGDDSAL